MTHTTTMPRSVNLLDRPPSVSRFQPLERPKPFAVYCLFGLLGTTLVDTNGLIARLTGIGESTSPIILLFCLVLLIAFQFRFREATKAPGTLFALLMGYNLIICSLIRLSDPSTENVFVTLYYTRTLITAPIVLFCVALGTRHIFLAYRTDKAMFMLLGMAMIPVAAIYLDSIFGSQVFNPLSSNVREKRAAGFFENPNAAGFAVVATTSLAFGCLALGKGRTILLACFAACLGACLLTFSRSSLVGFFLVAFSQVAFSPIFKQKALLILIPIICVGAVWVVFSGAGQMMDLNSAQSDRLESFTNILSGNFDANDTGKRFVVAANGVRFWLTSPVFGHGIGFSDGRDLDYKMNYGGVGPHNQFIATLMEGGIPLFALYSLFILVFGLAACTCKEIPIRVAAMSYVVGHAANAMVSHSLFHDKSQMAMMGICMGMLAAADRMRRVRRRHPAATVR